MHFSRNTFVKASSDNLEILAESINKFPYVKEFYVNKYRNTPENLAPNVRERFKLEHEQSEDISLMDALKEFIGLMNPLNASEAKPDYAIRHLETDRKRKYKGPQL